VVKKSTFGNNPGFVILRFLREAQKGNDAYSYLLVACGSHGGDHEDFLGYESQDSSGI
jgi:hypothetical protein